MAYLDNVYAVVQIAPTGIPTYVRLSQNENGRVLNFAVSGDALPAGSTVALTGTKPDGAVYSASGTLADNVATFNEDEQLTAVAGEWDAKVEVTNSGNLIATGRIKFVIDADPSGGNIPSDSQLDGYIAEMLSLLDAGKAEAYGSPLVASTVAGMTDQSRVYVYTGSETGYTAGNWYYWNGSSWTSGGVYNAVAVSTDTTLSIAGKAADAKATGDALDGLKDDLSHIEGISDDVKIALLDCFAHVAWTDEYGQDYYDALEEALYGSPAPEYNHTLLYRARDGVLLSEFDGLEVLGDTDHHLAENISNNILNLRLPQSSSNDYVLIRLTNYSPTDVTKARIKGKVRFNSLADLGNNYNNNTSGLGLSIKSGEKCAGIYTNSKDSATKNFAVRTSSNAVSNLTSSPITLNQWYELEASIEDNIQTIKVDGQVIYTDTGNTNLASSGALFTKSSAASGYLDMDIDWLSFEWNTDTSE